MRHVLFSIALFLMASGTCLATSEELNYNLVNLQAEATRQIDNDIIVVVLSALAEANSAHEAAQSVNQTMAWATDLIGADDEIKRQSLQYQTRPLYKNRTIIGWSVSQQLRLESSKMEKLTELTGRLQEKLGVSAMQFEISPARRKTAEDELVGEALTAFQDKARLIANSLGAKDYRLVNLSVNGQFPAAPYRHAFQAEDMGVQAARAPQVSAGESQVTIRVDGTIQLVY